MAKKVAKKSAKPSAAKPTTKPTRKVASMPAKKKSAKPAAKAAKKPPSKPVPRSSAKGHKARAPKATRSAPAKSKAPLLAKSAKPPAITKPGTPVVAAIPAPKAARAVKVPSAATLEAKPSAKLPTKPAAAAMAHAAAEPLFPIAPPSGQRDVDLATAIQKSRMFYAGHGLGALAGAIPSAADFPPAANAAIEEAHAIGLDDVFVFPPVALQRDSIEHLVHRLAAASSDRLQAEQQYGQPWLYQPEALKNFTVHGRPAGAYALCFYSGAFPRATGGKDAGELRDWLAQRRCASLTVYEYLVLQRIRAEQHGDHRFDLNTKDQPAQWHWLLDMSLGEGKDMKFPMAAWNPKMRRIELGWCGPRDLSPGKGTHATRVVWATVAEPQAV